MKNPKVNAYSVRVKGTVGTLKKIGVDEHGEKCFAFEDKAFTLWLTGEVAVEAINKKVAKVRALEVLHGTPGPNGLPNALSLPDGDVVEFAVTEVRRLDS